MVQARSDSSRPDDSRPELRVVVAWNVRRYRKELGWSQEKVARMADLSRNTIGAIEDARDPEKSENDTRLDTLEQVANGLGIEAWKLLVWDPEAPRV